MIDVYGSEITWQGEQAHERIVINFVELTIGMPDSVRQFMQTTDLEQFGSAARTNAVIGAHVGADVGLRIATGIAAYYAGCVAEMCIKQDGDRTGIELITLGAIIAVLFNTALNPACRWDGTASVNRMIDAVLNEVYA